MDRTVEITFLYEKGRRQVCFNSKITLSWRSHVWHLQAFGREGCMRVRGPGRRTLGRKHEQWGICGGRQKKMSSSCLNWNFGVNNIYRQCRKFWCGKNCTNSLSYLHENFSYIINQWHILEGNTYRIIWTISLFYSHLKLVNSYSHSC